MRPDVEKYLKTSDAVLAVGNARTISVSRHLLEACDIRALELQQQVTNNPERSNDGTQDIFGVLGELRGIEWVLDLEREAVDRLRQASEIER